MERTQLVHSHDIDLFCLQIATSPTLFRSSALAYCLHRPEINSACVGVRGGRGLITILREREYRGEIKKKKKCFYPLSESSQFTVKTEMVSQSFFSDVVIQSNKHGLNHAPEKH